VSLTTCGWPGWGLGGISMIDSEIVVRSPGPPAAPESDANRMPGNRSAPANPARRGPPSLILYLGSGAKGLGRFTRKRRFVMLPQRNELDNQCVRVGGWVTPTPQMHGFFVSASGLSRFRVQRLSRRPGSSEPRGPLAGWETSVRTISPMDTSRRARMANVPTVSLTAGGVVSGNACHRPAKHGPWVGGLVGATP